MNAQELAKYFDHTALKAETTLDDIKRLCHEARQLGTASVCINPTWIPFARQELDGSSVMVITVIGFPLGAMSTSAKIFEARDAIECGAQEIDMVLAVGKMKSQDHEYVKHEIRSIQAACGDIPLKVIFETCYLTEHEIEMATRWCAEYGVAFVKTSTGFGSRGASVRDLEIMRQTILSVPESPTRIKASGGIRTLDDVQKMIAAGADRIGASATVGIIGELTGKKHHVKSDY
ncbi:MAG: deoxyribose-phosphate aldolase [Proteobacteria bacterium]|nr:deoxyribose-phosphate aldolase [Pseudomonadota bacterium]